MSAIIEHIRADLLSLYEINKIEKADRLNTALGKKAFCENMNPMYFSGDLNAKTILIMLNPGAESREYSFEKNDKSRYKNFDEYFKTYMDKMINYGKYDFNRMDNFDLKQAAFLYHFKDSGIEIPQNFWVNQELKKEAKKNVLLNKLQMELIPYPSRTFSGLFDSASKAQKNIYFIEENIERLFNVILETERRYVVFCSKQFYHIFNALKTINPQKWKIKNGLVYRSKIGKLNLAYNNVNIEHNNETIKAGIAHSFASQALPNAIDKMSEYGKFCFETFMEE